MAKKRPGDFIDIESSQESDDVGFGVGSESQLFSRIDGLHGLQDSYGLHPEEAEHVDFDEVLKDYADIKVLKRKLALGLSCLQDKGFSRPNDAFTRGSMSGFSSVIDALTPDNRKIIKDYGFGSLLHFDKCTIPDSFAKWLAGITNYRSGDIILNDKVISLTKETVNLVLGLPLNEKPFPRNSSSGISVVLDKFNKKSVPSVSFFANKLLQHEPLCDDDVFICFIIVAMNNFLCPTHCDRPCIKYFGIFEDIKNVKELDWCGYVLEWLLQGVKNFNCGKVSKSYDCDTVAGCIYYLSVIYLDHVNFGSRQLPQTIPRICVWKGSMIKQYSDFDFKSSGCYGSHPLVHTRHSCYSKDLRNLYSPMSSCLDAGFNNKLDEYAGCKLPASLKFNICKLVQNYCLNSGLSINMDVQRFNAFPDEMKITFCKLLQHAYSIDSRSQKLVLDVIKLLSQSSNEHCTATSEDKALSSEIEFIQQTSTNNYHGHSNEKQNPGDLENAFNSDICPDHGLPDSSDKSDPNVPSSMHQASHAAINDINGDDGNASLQLPVPNLNRFVPKMCAKVINADVASVLQKLNKRSSAKVSTIAKNLSSSENPLAANVHASTGHNVDKKRIPLDDLSNELSTKRKKSVSFSPQCSSHVDVTMLENMNFYVPDSFSPVSIPGRRRFIPEKDLLYLQKSYLSNISSPTDISDDSNVIKPSSSQFNRQAQSSKVSPEVQIIGERSLADSVRDMSKKSDALYNSKFRRSQGTICSPIHVPENIPSCSRPLSSNLAPSVTHKVRESTTAAKLPSYGSRRIGHSGASVGGQDVSSSVKYHVSNSEVLNYDAICNLAFSEYQGEDVVYLYGVRCTFWSLGESLKPNGQVHSFVVSVFCYSLFLKPIRHCDVSKRYYFFSNIADNLLKNFDEADEDVLSRAFKRFSKSRPVTHSNMLFFPTFYDEHWFVFVVDIKGRKYVMLDSFFKEDDEYQQYASQRMRASFEYHWKKLLHIDISFEDFQLIYPAVPRQPSGHENDSGIYAMMFLEHWLPNTTSLSDLFGPKDIPNIRIKIANDLVFQPKNSGMKNRVLEFHVQVD
ncbi:unnamed protein product [Urochloa decumbens]|uniref:Ubiquitin-like protease family profile domain-containing protein n=1 Tax=Urochloa decumbens TaxID=240449 RepID=A0ABC8WJM6_9POAL